MLYRFIYRGLSAWWVVMLLSGLSCSSNPTEQSGGALEPTLSSIQANIFSPKCALSGCHVNGGLAPMTLQSADASFTNLVNVNSVQRPALKRVAPNDASQSYLMHKLEGAPNIDGEPMPKGGPPLSSQELNAIRDWINNGAARGQQNDPPSGGDDGGGY